MKRFSSHLDRNAVKMALVLFSLCLLLAVKDITNTHATVVINNSIDCSSGMSNPSLYTGSTISSSGSVYVLLAVEARPGVPVSVSDTMGSTYTLVNSAEANYAKTYLYLAQLASDMDAWLDHIDVNTNSNSADACALMISGLAADPIDGSAIGSDNWSTAMSTGSVTPTTSNTLLVGTFGWDSNVYSATPGSGWTERKESGTLQIETRQVSNGSYSASATLNYADRWAGVLVALKAQPPQPPTDILLSNNTMVTTDPPGTLIGTLTAVDPDIGETYTFSLVSGTGSTNNASFTINGNQLTNNTTLAAGTYSIRVNVNDGTNNFAKVFTVSVSAYPTITGGDTSYGDYITNVTFAGIDHDSGDDNGYADYTADTAIVSPRTSPNLFTSLMVSDGTNYPAIVVAWIDWNQNSSFDDSGEKYVIGSDLNITGLNTANANISVPAGALEGTTRMRIVSNADTGMVEPPNAGADIYYGEAEDYTIQVITCTSTGSTAWNLISTWTCGHVPGGNEKVIIAAGHTVSLSGNLTLNGPLVLNGNIDTTAGYVLTLGSEATITGAGDIIGTVRRTNPGTGSALQFNNQYTSLNFTTAPTQIDMKLVKTQPAGFPYAVDRTYTITKVGDAAATLRLAYKDTELHLSGGVSESSLALFRYDGGGWLMVGRSAGDTTANWVESDNVTTFSDWTISGNSPTDIKLKSLSGRTGGVQLPFAGQVWLLFALVSLMGGLAVLLRKRVG